MRHFWDAAAALDPAAFTTDVHEMEQALKAARSANEGERAPLLASAVDLYRGELLPGCYDDWIIPEQQRLDELYFQALHQLIAVLEQTGDLATALHYTLRAAGANVESPAADARIVRAAAPSPASSSARAASRRACSERRAGRTSASRAST